MFRLLRYFSITSGLALLGVALVLISVYRQSSLNRMVATVEAENVAMSRAFANSIWPRFASYVTEPAADGEDALRARSETAEIHGVAKSLVAGLDVVKIKIYRLDGLTVYSSDFSQIGIKDHNSSLILLAQRGKPSSTLEFRPEFKGINGLIRDRHIVASYMPIQVQSGGVEGIIELYSDVTARVRDVTTDVTWLSIGLVWTFGILYGVLFIFVRRADRIIKRQYTGLHREVGDRLKAETKLQRALDDAERANQTKGEFLAHMSHELRTPLNSIIGFSESMTHQVFGKMGNAKYLEYAKDIHGSGSHLLSLINEVLDVSKVEAGAMKINETDIDLAHTMRECAAMMKVEAEKVGINLQLSMPGDLPVFRGDVLRLKQIFLNLLSNAIKFTPSGGNITLEAGIDSGGGLRIAVADNGIGIKQEDISRILLPFEQVESHMQRPVKGTGLGLALSKSLTELHGGEMILESALDVGTTVTLRFPPERAIISQPELPFHL
ncbi:MAG: ATP-binding protein [Proteobacteria bacterium]|nr:ATP-binding protein [Pseudomonadota bacterium]